MPWPRQALTATGTGDNGRGGRFLGIESIKATQVQIQLFCPSSGHEHATLERDKCVG